MKRHVVLLLMILAFVAGIAFYRAAILAPAPHSAPALIDVGLPDAISPGIVLTNSRTDDADSIDLANNVPLDSIRFLAQNNADSQDFAVGDEPPDDAREPQPSVLTPDALETSAIDSSADDSLDPARETAPSDDIPLKDLDAFDAQVSEPTPPPLETTIKAVPAGSRVQVDSGDGGRVEAGEIRVRSPRTDAADSDNPIPEFLRERFRGGELPPLLAGQKVVTIPVPVDNWVDLGWGDSVTVEYEFNGVGVAGSAGVRGTIRLFTLEQIEIYALPQFAPEKSNTVPVCLKVNADQARQLLKFRKATGTFKLTVTKKHESQVYSIDDLSNDADRAAPAPIAPPNDFPRRADSARVEASEPLTPPANPAPNPSDTFAAPPAAFILDVESQRSTRESSTDDALPQIEPSEAGTVYELKDGNQHLINMGDPLLLEAPLRILRVTGFDQRIIRVTAENPKRLRILGTNPGWTAIKVTFDKGVLPPFNLSFHVEPDAREEQSQQIEEDEARRRADLEQALNKLYPHARLQLLWLPNAVVLRGTAANHEESAQITELAELYAPKVLNQLDVGPPGEVEPEPYVVAPEPSSSSRTIPEGKRVLALTTGNRPADVLALQPGQPVDVLKPGIPELIVAGVEVFSIDTKSSGQERPVVSLVVDPQQVNLIMDAQRDSRLYVMPSQLDKTSLHALIDVFRPLPHRVYLTFPDPAPLQSLKAGDRVDVHRVRVVRSGDKVEAEQTILATNATVSQVHVSEKGNSLVLVVPPDVAIRLSESDRSTLRIVPREQSSSDSERIGQLVDRGQVRPASPARNDEQAESSLRDDIRALHDDVRKLIALLEQRLESHTHPDAHDHGSPSADDPSPPQTFDRSEAAPAADEPTSAEAVEPVEADPAPSSADLRRTRTDLPPEWRQFLNDWGRAMLKRDFRSAMGIVHEHRRTDPRHDFYDRFAADTEEALAAGSSTKPLLVAALSNWSGPCRRMAPLIRRLQDQARDIVVLDADDDRELLKSLDITAVPTLAWIVDGRKQLESIGLTTQEFLDDFHKRGTRELNQPQDKSPDGNTFRIRRQGVPDVAGANLTSGISSGAYEAIEEKRAFSFYVGLTR